MYNFTPTPKLNPALKKAFYLITYTFPKKVIRDVLELSRTSNEVFLQK